MSSPTRFEPGISTLLERHPDWLRGRRVAIVSHPAAVDASGRQTVEAVLAAGLARHVELWGPEHGYFGDAGAGEPVRDSIHPLLGVRILSLYGATRTPTPAMLRNVDLVLLDLQDLAVRCYTYLSTLRAVLESAAAHGVPVIVADRPVPFPATVDGPLLDPACHSFVGAIPAPLVYGMTPAETAIWLRSTLALEGLDLRVAPMLGYTRDPHRGANWPTWIPPSPGIATWESAWCYPATVLTEALTDLDCARAGRLPFQSLAAPWIEAGAFAAALTAAELPGVAFHAAVYRRPRAAPAPPRRLQGVRMVVTNPARYQPVLTAVTLLAVLQQHHGARRLWARRNLRADFFDKLFGTARVRQALQAEVPPATLAAEWRASGAAFRRARADALLYRGGS